MGESRQDGGVPTNNIDECRLASDDELYSAIAHWLLPDPDQLSPTDIRRAVDLGKAWMANHLEELRDLVCSHPQVVAVPALVDADGSELVGAIADALSTVGHYPPVVVLAVLVTRYGLDKLCS